MPKSSSLATFQDEVISLYQSGLSLSEVGERFGVSETSVRRLFRRLGISSRPLSEANKLLWKPEIKEKRRLKIVGRPAHNKGKRWTYNRVIQRPGNRGEKNPFWKGGKTAIGIVVRGLPEYRFWRDAVFQRDNYTCVLCGTKTGGGLGRVDLNADHITPLSVLLEQLNVQTAKDARNTTALWDVANGRTLCHSCHRTTKTYGRTLLALRNV